MLHPRPVALLLLPFLCLVVCPLVAQRPGGNLQVFVTLPDDHPSGEQLRVQLISGDSGVQVAETYTDNRGRAQFDRVGVGSYTISISGQTIEATVSDPFQVDERKTTQSISLRVKPISTDANRAGSGASVSAGDLKVPEQASKEFDKATKLMAKQQWPKAIDQLNKALAIYPAYAEAYTNLGVVYAKTGDPVKEREALQKAIVANDHFAPGFVNLARMEIREHNFTDAEAHLKQAAAIDPTDVPTLALLAQVQLLDHHYADSVANARKVHSMAHESYALVHYVAARACERMNRLADAIAEFKLFLSEEPAGDRATAARLEMNAIQQQGPQK
jgi:tetratricopeptide (TPR) repeat protein